MLLLQHIMVPLFLWHDRFGSRKQLTAAVAVAVAAARFGQSTKVVGFKT